MRLKTLLMAICLVMLGVVPAFATFTDVLDLTGDTSPFPFHTATSYIVGSITYGGSLWKVVEDRPTGSGVYDPFLTFGATPQEAGMNTNAISTNANPIYDDSRTTNNYTRAVLYSELSPLMDGQGNKYYSFTIDINEAGTGSKDRFLSIENVAIYSSASDVERNTTGLTKEWEMNPDTVVLTDFSLASSGSGRDDVQFLVPYFAPTAAYMYLYIHAGAYGDVNDTYFSSMDGYEEVRGRVGENTVPEPSIMLFLGSGLIGLAGLRRRFKA